MEELKDDYRQDASIFQYIIDTLLLPVRIATSPALLRTYLRTILLFITSSILFGLAVIAYSSFYYSYIPVRGISVPVYLQFDHGKSFSFLSARSENILPGQSSRWPYGIANVPDLISRQKYDVVVEMTVPRSRSNLDAGNWMVGLELRGPSSVGGGVKSMLGWDEEWNVEDHSQGGGPGSATQHASDALTGSFPVLARSKRPGILTYRSYIIEHAYRLLRLPLYLIGWGTESEHIEIGMMESVEFDKGTRNVPSSIKVELRSRHPLEVYTVKVRFSARLEGLRWIMYRYWLTSAVVGTGLFWSVEMGVLVFTWGIFTLLFSRSNEPTEGTKSKKLKQEPDTPIKNEPADSTMEPNTPLSDASRTFPTLPSQQALHYTSASTPKDERNTPALEDIPMKEDAEADDEEDDDFVLEEPVPVRTEREGIFTDSGIGTGLENIDGERGLARRRSGRLKEDDK